MPADEESVVQIETLNHRYGATVALESLSLSVRAGSTVAFIGPDGVGKSTLVGVIAGVKRIQSGTVKVLGGNMASRIHRDAVAPRIAYMPQGLGRNQAADHCTFESAIEKSNEYAVCCNNWST